MNLEYFIVPAAAYLIGAIPFGYLIGKETPKSPHKIDACMASVLAYAARSKYLQEQREERRRSRVTRVR